MNLTDIITLAKQGYKPGDIKELIELSKAAEPEPKKDPEPAIVPPEEQKEPKVAKNDFQDFETEIQKLKEENEKIKADLQAAQEENRRKAAPAPEPVSRDEQLKDIARAFWR